MKKAILLLIVLGVIGGGAYAYWTFRNTGPEPTVTTGLVSRGDIAETVGSTGTLQAVTTVQVGTQVSGIVQELYADFNSLVKKGQVIARLDPSTIETQIQQAEANLVRARADRERLVVQLEDARVQLKRDQELFARNLIPATQLEASQVAVKSSEASLKSSDASVGQSEASLNQNKVNLNYTIITAPIDGLVISRNVDRGQTVAASMNAPVLFTLAADLTKMQLLSNIDESDVGRIRPGQNVTFRVDAFPTQEFTGKVSQVRLNPIVQQNVVSYATVIDVANPELKLKPGMTANVTIEIARKSAVLRVPNSALRFRPTADMYTALKLTPPGEPRAQTDGPTNGERNGGPGATRGAAAPEGRANAESARGRAGQNENLSPEERAQMVETMRGRGGRSGRGGGPNQAAAPQTPAPPANTSGATTIDALFGPLPVTESRGQVWVREPTELRPIRLRLGITDGQLTEVLEGDVQEGQELVTNIITGAATRPQPGVNPNQQFNPFGQPGGGRGPGGGGGGGGNRGGGGGGRGF